MNYTDNYRCPRKVLTTQEECMACFKALWSLSYGNPTEYLQMYKELIEKKLANEANLINIANDTSTTSIS